MDLYLDAHWDEELLRLPFDLHSRQHRSRVGSSDPGPVSIRAQQLHGLHWLPLGTLTALTVLGGLGWSRKDFSGVWGH